MAKRYGFFNSINGDRRYLATDLSTAFDITTKTGLQAVEGSFEIVPHENMTVKMKPGGCMIFGHYCIDDEDEFITLDTADGELNRIDRIVMRYDKFERSIKTVVIKGTPALTPTAPAPLRNENQFDLVLADIRINKATTMITTSNITDMRESDLCGYIGVEGAVSSLEFDNHVNGPFHIVESGSNSNGSYIKFADGTMICRHHISQRVEGDKTYTKDWLFPAGFIEKPELFSGAGNNRYVSGGFNFSGDNTTNIKTRTFLHNSYSSSLALEMSVMAIGRWR